MPLTRHLYVEDEVAAALQFCVLRGRPVEAAFWAMELLDSGMVEEFFASLRKIWLLGFGLGSLGWYKAFIAVEAEEALDAEAALQLVVGLCRIGVNGGRDTTALAMISSTAAAERSAPSAALPHLEGLDSYFAACILQGRTISAWRAFSRIGDAVLEEVAAKKHGDAGIETIGLLAKYPPLLIGALCLPRGSLASRLVIPARAQGTLKEVEQELCHWERDVGRKARRAFTIPHQCLYWLTERGRTTVYTSSDAKLRGSLERPGKLWGSVFWDSVAVEAGGWEELRNNSEKREAFYDTFFPDDIPDEWSAIERAKSHGIGCMQKDETPSIKKFVRSWFGSYGSAVVWNHGQESALLGNMDECCITRDNHYAIELGCDNRQLILPCIRLIGL